MIFQYIDPKSSVFANIASSIENGVIEQAVEIEDGYLIRIFYNKLYIGKERSRNIWKIDKKGKLVWKINKLVETSETSSPFCHISIDNGRIVVSAWVGVAAYLNPANGNLLERWWTN